MWAVMEELKQDAGCHGIADGAFGRFRNRAEEQCTL